MAPPPDDLPSALAAVPAGAADRAVRVVDLVLAAAVGGGASDVHLDPTPAGLDVRFRADGLLRTVARLPAAGAANVVARLKVLADLLTYRTDVPQEGGIRAAAPGGVELRVATFPTVHGEKAVVRVFDPSAGPADLAALGLPPDVLAGLTGLLAERTGAVLLTGPGGSGKTTTIYACLRRLAGDGSGRHIATVEDPVERVVPGVTQSQVRPGTEFDFARGLRSLLRQDPEVIVVGEVRDRETAAVAAEAALTGHLVLSTLHAGSAAGGVSRLVDMGVEPYLLTGGLKGVVNQRLVRRLCDGCKRPAAGGGWEPVGCGACGGTGYRGRFPLAEMLLPTPAFRKAVLARADADDLAAAAGDALKPIRAAAAEAVAAGQTTSAEVTRVLGPAGVLH